MVKTSICKWSAWILNQWCPSHCCFIENKENSFFTTEYAIAFDPTKYYKAHTFYRTIANWEVNEVLKNTKAETITSTSDSNNT